MYLEPWLMWRMYIITLNCNCAKSNLVNECAIVIVEREFSLTLAIL